MRDQFGRDLTYLRVSVTDRCNLRCTYCMPEEGVEPMTHDEILSLEELYYVVREFVQLGVTKLRLTGGEPLVRRNIIPFIESVSRLEQLKDISMTTNGILLKTMAKDLQKHGLHRVNVSLDTLRADRFRLLSRGGNIQDVLDGIDAVKEAGLKVKLNCVVNRGINDDEIIDFITLTKTWGVDVRFIELMPIGKNIDYAHEHFYSNDEILQHHPQLKPVKAEDPSSPAKYYQFEDAKGKVGLISPLTCSFCANCNRLRLTSDGKLKPCLHSDLEIDLKTPLREGADIRPYMLQAYTIKPEKHLLEEHRTIVRQMSRIGG